MTPKHMTASAALAHTTNPDLIAAQNLRAMLKGLLVEHGGRNSDEAAFIAALSDKGFDIAPKTDAMMVRAAAE